MGKKTSEVLRAAGIKTSGGGKSGGGERKYGRERRHAASARYTSERRWEDNRLRRVRRHLKRLPNDLQAREVLARDGGPDERAFLAKLPKVQSHTQDEE